VTREQFAELRRLLPAGGYQQEAPSSQASEIDGGIVEGAACEACGQVGLTYAPFTLRGSYRAFAVCPACGAAEEF
jgi:hypothetical protein